MKATNEQIEKSRSKAIIQGHDYKTLTIVFDELEIVDKSVRNLWELAISTEDEKLKASIFQFFIELRVAKPKQEHDVTSGGDRIESVSVEIIRPNAPST